MKTKIFSAFIFSIFLLSMASAMTVYADFSDGSQSAVITEGGSISFNADFFSMSPPIISMKVQVYQGNNLIYTFLDSTTNERTYSNAYAYIAPAGTYEIRIIGKDSINTDSESLSLTVNPVPSIPPIPPIPPVKDTVSPVITLLGSNPQTITIGDSYVESGATALDDIDGDISSKIQITNNVNSEVIGAYTVIYHVSDNAGNTATATRNIDVVSPGDPEDITPPIITVISPEENGEYSSGSITLRIETNEEADVTFRLDEGASRDMINSYDNIFTYGLSGLSGGEHFITFYAEDLAGNVARENVRFEIKLSEKKSGSGGGSIGSIGTDDVYYQNKYFDQFEDKNIFYAPKQTKQSDNILLIIFLITLIIAFSIILGALIIFLARKPKIHQKPRVQELNPDEVYY